MAIQGRDETRRVIGGVDATIEEFPFVVSIRMMGRHHCGGSIVTKYWILTAAHCLLSQSNECYPPYVLTLVSGLTDVRGKVTKHERKVSEVIPHSDFLPSNEKSVDNDIGLLKAKTPIEFGPAAQPVALPPGLRTPRHHPVAERSRCVVIGWGVSNTSSPSFVPKLHKVRVAILNSELCQEVYAIENMQAVLCAGSLLGGKDSCQGDSGGPLLCSDGVQMGVVSWGMDCAKLLQPGVYTRTDYFRDWIDEHIGLAAFRSRAATLRPVLPVALLHTLCLHMYTQQQ